MTNTYKTVTRPILEYGGTIFGPTMTKTQLTHLQTKQIQALRIATGCTADTSNNHLYDETNILPLKEHLRIHGSQLRQKATDPDHPLHRLTEQSPRLMKRTIFNNNDYTINKDTEARLTDNNVRQNLNTIHSIIAEKHLNNRPPNKLLNRPPPQIDKTEETLPRITRRRLSHLRADKSPLLMTYLR